MKYLFGLVFAGVLATSPAFAEASKFQDSVQLRETAHNGIINYIGVGSAERAAAVLRCTGKTHGMQGPLTVRVAALTGGTAMGRPGPSVAKQRIKAMGDAAMSILRRSDMQQEARQREFRRLLMNNFDVHAIAILTLGRHRTSATRRQLAEFDRLFFRFLLVRIAELLENYVDESFKVNDVVNVGRRDVVVRSRIVPERGEAKEVQWLMREFNGRPQIIDVRVDNISLVITQRNEFNSVIQREGMDGLLHRLRKQVNGRSTEIAH